MTDYAEFPTMKSVELEAVKLASRLVIDKDGLQGVNAELILDEAARVLSGQLVMMLRADTKGRKIVREEVVTVPEDWWAAFKLRWFPSWWLRRWPAKMREIVSRREDWWICPHLPEMARKSHMEWVVSVPERYGEPDAVLKNLLSKKGRGYEFGPSVQKKA